MEYIVLFALFALSLVAIVAIVSLKKGRQPEVILVSDEEARRQAIFARMRRMGGVAPDDLSNLGAARGFYHKKE